MRAWLIVLAACGTEKPVVRGAPFTPVLCKGTPGTDACPYTPDDLGLADSPGSEVKMLLRFDAGHRLNATGIVITAGSVGLYAESPRFDQCPLKPQPTPAMWPDIDLAAGESQPLDGVVLLEVPICFAADAIGPYRP
jgi:hypothetical protein